MATVPCPYCNGLILDNGSFYLGPFTCPHCGQQLEMPSSPAAPLPPLAADTPPSRRQTGRRTRKKKQSAFGWGFGIGCGVLCAFVAFGFVSCAVLVGGIGSCAAVVDESLRDASQQSKSRQPTKSTNSSRHSRRLDHRVGRWSGNSQRRTPPFTIRGNRFKVKWSCQLKQMDGQRVGVFQIFVHADSDGQLVDLLANTANTPGEQSEAIVRHGPGRFYLDINTFNTSWEVSVYD